MNYLRYLSPKSPFSERGLAIASLKSLMLFFLFMYMFLSLLLRPRRVFALMTACFVSTYISMT